MKKVGVIGCGAMGKGVVKNFLLNGYEVYIYDVNEQALLPLKEMGANPVSDVKEIGKVAEVLVTSLPTPEILMDSLSGAEGAFSTLEPGSIIIDLSTVDAKTAISLYEEAKEKELLFLDCPVSGGPNGADQGTLTIMAAGRHEDYLEALSYLEAIGSNIFYTGESGSGQTTKLVHNMVVGAMTLALGEAFAIANKVNINLETLRNVLASGSANRVLDVYGDNIVNQSYENVLFSLNHMQKDIRLYKETVENLKGKMVIGELVNTCFDEAKEKGYGHLDSSAVIKVITD